MTKFPSDPELLKYVPARYRLSPPAQIIPPPLPGEVFLREVAMYFREMPYGAFVLFCKETGADPQCLKQWSDEMRDK